MIPQSVPIPYSSNYVQGSLGGNVHGLVPTGIEITIYDSRFGEALLVLIAKHHVWITETAHVAGL